MNVFTIMYWYDWSYVLYITSINHNDIVSFLNKFIYVSTSLDKICQVKDKIRQIWRSLKKFDNIY